MRGTRNMRLIAAAGLLVAVILLVLLTLHHRSVMTAQVQNLGEKNHRVLSNLLTNALWSDLAPLTEQTASAGPALRSRPEIAKLLAQLQGYTTDLALVDFKLLSRHGVTILSTHLPLVGEDRSSDPKVVEALRGNVTSRIRADETPAFLVDTGAGKKSILESVIPLRRGPDQRIVGVMEIHQDITGFMKQVEAALWRQIVITTLLTCGLVLLFHLVIRRLQADLKSHEEDRHTFIKQIQSDKAELEKRIQERTRELTRMNQALQIEVEVRRQTDVELCLAANVYQNTTEGIVVTDAQGIIESVNPAFTAITGYKEEEAVHKPMLMLFSSQHDEVFYRHLDQELTTHGRWRGEVWSQRKDGSVYPEFANINAIKDGAGVVRQYVKVFSDLSGIKRSEQQLHFLVHHDALTGLPNRLLLKDRMRQAFSYAARFNQIVGVLFLGIDRFTLINDAVGRQIGDRLLREVAVRLAHCLRDEDSLARVGGDEFVVLATGLQQGGNAGRIARKLLSTLNEPFLIETERYYLTASIGITLNPLDEGDEDAHLKKAESAMRRAKEQGGNMLHFFTKEIDAVSVKRMTIENGLRLALERNELFLLYQPQMDVISGRLMGVEALIRWKSAEMGLVSPVNFIPIAEESDLIASIGEWVLRTACRQNRLWQDQGFEPIRMAVNLSARQFQNRDLPVKVARILEDSGLDARYLELELTEGMFMRDANETVTTLQTLRNMNLQLSIDDFGTGYSSLSYLKRFPIHTLKIDRAFVRDVITDPDDAAITKTILSMAKNLNLQVVAEGVSDPDQLEFLRSLGCDLVQGFLFSPPVSPEEIAKFLEEDRLYREKRIFAPKLHSGSGSVIVFPEFNQETKAVHHAA
ncbi:MAG: EAL domain-containing protein [Magnetococcus sp. YQC-9]